jgi:hypothetical protein
VTDRLIQPDEAFSTEPLRAGLPHREHEDGGRTHEQDAALVAMWERGESITLLAARPGARKSQLGRAGARDRMAAVHRRRRMMSLESGPAARSGARRIRGAC